MARGAESTPRGGQAACRGQRPDVGGASPRVDGVQQLDDATNFHSPPAEMPLDQHTVDACRDAFLSFDKDR
jgi:hypothetical protein